MIEDWNGNPEWADILADEKCGGDKPKPHRAVKIGERYRLVWFSMQETDEIMEIETEEDRAWLERVINDPENDTLDAYRMED